MFCCVLPQEILKHNPEIPTTPPNVNSTVNKMEYNIIQQPVFKMKNSNWKMSTYKLQKSTYNLFAKILIDINLIYKKNPSEILNKQEYKDMFKGKISIDALTAILLSSTINNVTDNGSGNVEDKERSVNEGEIILPPCENRSTIPGTLPVKPDGSQIISTPNIQCVDNINLLLPDDCGKVIKDASTTFKNTPYTLLFIKNFIMPSLWRIKTTDIINRLSGDTITFNPNYIGTDNNIIGEHSNLGKILTRDGYSTTFTSDQRERIEIEKKIKAKCYESGNTGFITDTQLKRLLNAYSVPTDIRDSFGSELGETQNINLRKINF